MSIQMWMFLAFAFVLRDYSQLNKRVLLKNSSRNKLVPSASARVSPPYIGSLQASIRDGDTVVIFGGTGGVGQLVTRRLLQQYPSIQLRIVTRDVQRAAETLRDLSSNDSSAARRMELVPVDTLTPTDPLQLERTEQQLNRAMDHVSAIVIAVGTTAFPTARWKNGNTPQAIDADAIARIVRIASNQPQTSTPKPSFSWPFSRSSTDTAVQSLKRIVLVTSIGVQRTNVMPFLFLNLFKVLDAKRTGELAVIQGAQSSQRNYMVDTKDTTKQGWDYAIVRPGRLVGGPYTNLDVAKLMQTDGGNDFAAVLETGDSLLGDCKRITCADAVVQCLFQNQVTNIDFSIISAPGNPWTGQEWNEAFRKLGNS